MNIFTLGLWGTVDQSLQWIGKEAARLLTRRSGSAEENAIIGGALVCAVFGGVTGFALSDFSRSTVVSGGAIIGSLLGACSGVLFGSFVVTVDDTIKHVLASLKSKWISLIPSPKSLLRSLPALLTRRGKAAPANRPCISIFTSSIASRLASLILSQQPTTVPSRSSLEAMTRFPEPNDQDEHEQ